MTGRLMIDHPGWVVPTGKRRAHRIVRDEAGGISVAWAEYAGSCLFVEIAPASDRCAKTSTAYFDPLLANGPLPLALAAALRVRGSATRLATPCLWESLATQALHQFVAPKNRAGLYRRICQVYGQRLQVAGHDVWLFPTPSALLAVDGKRSSDWRLGVKVPVLQRVAEAYLQHGRQWNALTVSRPAASELIEAITSAVPLRPAAVARAVADHTNDASAYPADSVLRSRVRQLPLAHLWPVEAEAFGREWRAQTQPQESLWTTLVLASEPGACLSR